MFGAGKRVPGDGRGFGAETKSWCLGSATEIDSSASEQGGRSGRESVWVPGRRWAGDRDPCLRWGFSHVGP